MARPTPGCSKIASMGAADPLKRAPGRRLRFRTVDPATAPPREGQPVDEVARIEFLRCNYRPADADFYCWKYGVWYNLMDCCYRHDRKTYPGCAGCGQGSNNLRQNRQRYRDLRPNPGSRFAR